MLIIFKNIYSRLRINLYIFLSLPFILILNLLPKRLVVEIIQNIEILKSLDYKKNILIKIKSDIEYDLRLRSMSKEPETVKWLEQTFCKDSVFYDIGSNIGAYSLLASRLSSYSTIYSFEPVPSTFDSLTNNIILNNAKNIHAFNLAISNLNCMQYFQVRSMKHGDARHAGLVNVGNANLINVLCTNSEMLINNFGFKYPTHLKIDVDGSEKFVLEGMEYAFNFSALKNVLIEIDENSPDFLFIIDFFKIKNFIVTGRHQKGSSLTFNYIFLRH
jgi:FkbM family methyltransferase